MPIICQNEQLGVDSKRSLVGSEGLEPAWSESLYLPVGQEATKWSWLDRGFRLSAHKLPKILLATETFYKVQTPYLVNGFSELVACLKSKLSSLLIRRLLHRIFALAPSGAKGEYVEQIGSYHFRPGNSHSSVDRIYDSPQPPQDSSGLWASRLDVSGTRLPHRFQLGVN